MIIITIIVRYGYSYLFDYCHYMIILIIIIMTIILYIIIPINYYHYIVNDVIDAIFNILTSSHYRNAKE